MRVFSSRTVANGGYLVLMACAIVVTLLVVRRELGGSSRSASDGNAESSQVMEWQSYAAEGQRIGPADAQVVVTVFSDYQCPWCKKLDGDLRALQKEFPNEMAIVMRHYPLTSLHPEARNAALAAECAAGVGHFIAYHELLFANADILDGEQWGRLAAQAGIPDTTAFVGCLAEQASGSRLRADAEAAERLGIQATPMLLVNETRFTGAPDSQRLRSVIEKTLGRR